MTTIAAAPKPDFADHMDRAAILISIAGHSAIDLDFLEQTVTMAETIGPFIDPTKFMREGATNLEQQRRVLELVIPFVRGARELVEEARREREVRHV